MRLGGKSLSVSEFFCGAGGLSYGFTQAGIPAYIGMDFNPRAANVYRRNHRGAGFLCVDIHLLESGERKATIFPKADIRILCGAPPCQGFSTVGYLHEASKTGELGKQKRNIPEVYARYVARLKPEIIVLENVPKMLDYGGGELFSRFKSILIDAGYALSYEVLDFSHYGLAQSRQRLILLGSLLGKAIPLPKPPGERSTLRDAFKGLRPLANNQADPVDPLHYNPNLNEQRVKRYAFMLKHKPKTWAEVPYSLLPHRIKKLYGDKELERTRRIVPVRGLDELAMTLVRKYGGIFDSAIHPTEPRVYTLREQARIQGFPDDYDFCHDELPRATIAGFIAGAVSPVISAALASQVLNYVRLL